MTHRKVQNAGVYRIENLVNGRLYIGSAVNPSRRWIEHQSGLNRGTHRNDKLQKAWNKYGSSAFSFSVLELVDPANLILREQFWIDLYDAASHTNYNILPVAGSRLGCKASPETIERLRISHLGQVRSKEATEKAAASNRGRKRTPEMRARIRASMIGRVISPAQRRLISEAGKGRVVSAETRKKISAVHKGKRLSEDHIRKLSESKMKRLITINGEEKYLCQWIAGSGIKRSTVMMRIGKYGWSMERALTVRP